MQRQDTRFSKCAQQLREAFPTWTAIYKDPKSIGSQFLQVVGLQLDDVEYMLNYAYDQAYIDSADVDQIDTVYRATLPNELTSDMSYALYGDGVILNEKYDPLEFLATQTVATNYDALQVISTCYVDFANKYVYVFQPFDAETQEGLEDYEYGKITLNMFDEQDRISSEITLPLELHMIWNFFDEFGLLLNVPRLYGEKNAAYKERILDVFRRPSNSTKEGLINGIARELGLVQEVMWEDPTIDLILDEPRINIETITVDGEKWPQGFITVGVGGKVSLDGLQIYSPPPPVEDVEIVTEEDETPLPTEDDLLEEATREAVTGKARVVRYVAGVDMHELHDKEDLAFQNRLFANDGTATALLRYYAQAIHDRVPTHWGQFKWNQGFWDIAALDMSGYGYIPNFYDARFLGWKGYTPKED